MVPKSWEVRKLEELCPNEAPITYGVLKPGEFFPGGIPLLQIKDLRDGYVLTNDLHLISPELDKEYKRSRIVKNDILISLVGTIGRIAKYRSDSEANIHRNIGRIRTKSHEYLYHFLNSSLAQNEIGGSSSGSSQSALNLSTLRSMKVPLPPLPEQKKIAQILSTWDQAIAATERVLENSQKRKKALMQQLLTGKKRLPGFEGEWETTKVGKICKLGAGQSAPQGQEFFDKGIHDFLRVSDIGSSAGRFAPVSRDKINDRAVKEKRLSKVPAGATVFTKSGASLLLNQRAQLKTDTYIVSHLGFALGTEHSDDDFIYYLFCLIDFGKIAAGTSLPALQLSTLSQIKVTVPTRKQEQNAIAQILGVADREIERIRKRLLLLKQEKQALMQQLLTGKRRVQLDTEAA